MRAAGEDAREEEEAARWHASSLAPGPRSLVGVQRTPAEFALERGGSDLIDVLRCIAWQGSMRPGLSLEWALLAAWRFAPRCRSGIALGD